MSKYSSFKSHQLIMENWRRYLNEKADPEEVDPGRFPKELDRVSTKLARKYTRSGSPELDKSAEDDVIDVVSTGDKGIPVGELKPSQSSMNIGKAMAFVVQMLHPKGKLKPGGNLGAFISQDNYIMDGHHRWIATGMIDPSLGVGGYKVGFPAPELIAVLNAITKGRLGIQKGKEASGGFNQFTPENIEQQLMKMATEGHPWGNLEAEDVIAALEKYTGQEGEAAVQAAADKLANNLGQLTLQAPGFAPERPQMPVIDPEKVAGALKIAVNALQSGEVDVNPPYGAGGGQEHGQEKGSGEQISPDEWEGTDRRQDKLGAEIARGAKKKFASDDD